MTDKGAVIATALLENLPMPLLSVRLTLGEAGDEANSKCPILVDFSVPASASASRTDSNSIGGSSVSAVAVATSSAAAF